MSTLFRLVDVNGNEYSTVEDYNLQLALEELNQQFQRIQTQQARLDRERRRIEVARNDVLQQIQRRKFETYLQEREQEARLQEYYAQRLQEKQAFENVIRAIVQHHIADDERQLERRREREARRLMQRILVSRSPDMQLVLPSGFDQLFIHHPAVDETYMSSDEGEVENDTVPEEGPRVSELQSQRHQADRRSGELSPDELEELNEYLSGVQRRLNKRGNPRQHYAFTSTSNGTNHDDTETALKNLVQQGRSPMPEVIEPEDVPAGQLEPSDTSSSTVNETVSDDAPSVSFTASHPREPVPTPASSKPVLTPADLVKQEDTSSELPTPIEKPSDAAPSSSAVPVKEETSASGNTAPLVRTSSHSSSHSGVSHRVTIEDVPDEEA
ncbi:hypothetical protein SJAG_04590 [Schizosaccharomyces japonicus yFS275]|uniref:Uncharacterized protein n=1 Tax=Schizosaccharomyces japonicus (strain yFS275 / FY16936) TaxID=402676 RepID=B6K784_SCHJY|nr:hypothetical protein SJAG_04590 [Schizosaccharomyces japonicus yFS275]EEB09388.1 hypothetical protein SJAG_04590 [Schizosaccharomyces japonicus yFS275]